MVERSLGDLELQLGSVEEPATFAEAEQDDQWRRTMMEEMSAIEENRTWELVNLPVGCRSIGLKWVYKVRVTSAVLWCGAAQGMADR